MPTVGAQEDYDTAKARARDARRILDDVLATAHKEAEQVNEPRATASLRDREAEDEEFVNAFVQETGQ